MIKAISQYASFPIDPIAASSRYPYKHLFEPAPPAIYAEREIRHVMNMLVYHQRGISSKYDKQCLFGTKPISECSPSEILEGSFPFVAQEIVPNLWVGCDYATKYVGGSFDYNYHLNTEDRSYSDAAQHTFLNVGEDPFQEPEKLPSTSVEELWKSYLRGASGAEFSEDTAATWFEPHFTNICARLAKREKILITCSAGMSRSVAFTTALLMKAGGYTLKEALDIVKSRRPVADPAPIFIKMLEVYEKWLY